MTIKARCHVAVREAIKRGILHKRPCERCLKPFEGPAHNACHKVMAHHDDYSKPLVVTWLCYRHHIERHEELGWGLKPRVFPREKLATILVGERIKLKTREPVLFRATAHQAAKRLQMKVVIAQTLTICRAA